MAAKSRVNFSLIKQNYNKIGKSNVRLTQSSLFITKDIDATKSSYDFDVLENQTQTLQPDEIRLNINDEFFDLDFLYFLKVGFVFRAKTDFFFSLAYSVSFPNIGKIIAFGLI